MPSESWLSKNALRLLRENWKNPAQLAQELYMIASNQPSAGVSAQSADVQGRKPVPATPIVPATPLRPERSVAKQPAVPINNDAIPSTPATLAPIPGGLKRDTSESFVPKKKQYTQNQSSGVPELATETNTTKPRTKDSVDLFAPAVSFTTPAASVSSTFYQPSTTDAALPSNGSYPAPREHRQDYAMPATPRNLFSHPVSPFPVIDLIGVPGGGGTSTFIGQLSGDSNGTSCNVVLYPDGPDNNAGDTVTVTILQLADGENIPDGTWLGSIQLLSDSSGNDAYYAQVPIWLA